MYQTTAPSATAFALDCIFVLSDCDGTAEQAQYSRGVVGESNLYAFEFSVIPEAIAQVLRVAEASDE